VATIGRKQRRHRVLVVDDEPLFVDTICEFLATLPGFDVARAANGQAAIDAVRHDPPDLVLLDLNMPVMNGLDALRQIRALNASLPVLMITGSDAASAAAGLAAGAYGYLPKPMDLRYIQHLVGVAVGADFAHA
jgi:CheY-like chemotaxis protein